MYAAGTPGDLIWTNQADQMHFYSAAGMLKPLDELAKRDKYDLGGFYPKAIADNQWNGGLYGLPWQSHAGLSGLYINVDLAQQQGVALPKAGASWTLEEFEAAARRLTDEASGRWGVYMDAPSVQLFQNFAYSFGATILNADGSKHELNDPKLIAGLEWMADMIHRRRLAPKPMDRPGNAWDNLAQKKVAMYIAGAWTYAKWFCEDQQLIDWMRLWGGNPTGRLKLNETHYASGELAEYRKPHIAQLQSGKYRGAPTPKNQRQVDLKTKLLAPKLTEVWRGEKTVRAALQELEAPVTALLAEPLQGK